MMHIVILIILVIQLVLLIYIARPKPARIAEPTTGASTELGVCLTKQFTYPGGKERIFHDHPRCNRYSGPLPSDQQAFHKMAPLSVETGQHEC